MASFHPLVAFFNHAAGHVYLGGLPVSSDRVWWAADLPCPVLPLTLAPSLLKSLCPPIPSQPCPCLCLRPLQWPWPLMTPEGQYAAYTACSMCQGTLRSGHFQLGLLSSLMRTWRSRSARGSHTLVLPPLSVCRLGRIISAAAASWNVSDANDSRLRLWMNLFRVFQTFTSAKSTQG